MKTLKIILILFLLAAPVALFAQGTEKKYSETIKKDSEGTTRRKTRRVTYKDSIRAKENAPILNDNGTSSTTGTIDGRSATGRPGADTTVSYTVKRKKTTIKTVYENQPPVEKKKKKQP